LTEEREKTLEVNDSEPRWSPALELQLKSYLERSGGTAKHILEYGAGITTRLLSDFIGSQSWREEALLLSIEKDLQRLLRVCQVIERRPFHYFPLLIPLNVGSRDVDVGELPRLFANKFDFVLIHSNSPESLAGAAIALLSIGTALIYDHRAETIRTARKLFDDVVEDGDFLVLRQPRRPRGSVTSADSRSGERRGIVIPVQGAMAKTQWQISRPWAEAYARKIGAEILAVEVPAAVPPLFVKFYAAREAAGYDRVLMLDTDILIRRHAPDIFDLVPYTHLGAAPGGRASPIVARIDKAKTFYGAIEIEESDYFNAGVLVVNRGTLRQLFELPEQMLASPRYEQDYVIWKAAQSKIPCCKLPTYFNYIPNAKYTSVDWRHSFFYHFAGSGKDRYRHRTALFVEGRFEGSIGWRSAPLFSRNMRTFLMRVADQQYQGRRVVGFDPDDMTYKSDSTIAVLEDENAYMLVRKGRGIGVYGPYTTFKQGHYRIRAITSGLALELGGRDIRVDVVADKGGRVLLPPTKVIFGDDGVATLPDVVINELIEKVEFRLYRNEVALRLVMGIEVETLQIPSVQ
jgi:hypothetical protein